MNVYINSPTQWEKVRAEKHYYPIQAKGKAKVIHYKAKSYTQIGVVSAPKRPFNRLAFAIKTFALTILSLGFGLISKSLRRNWERVCKQNVKRVFADQALVQKITHPFKEIKLGKNDASKNELKSNQEPKSSARVDYSKSDDIAPIDRNEQKIEELNAELQAKTHQITILHQSLQEIELKYQQRSEKNETQIKALFKSFGKQFTVNSFSHLKRRNGKIILEDNDSNKKSIKFSGFAKHCLKELQEDVLFEQLIKLNYNFINRQKQYEGIRLMFEIPQITEQEVFLTLKDFSKARSEADLMSAPKLIDALSGAELGDLQNKITGIFKTLNQRQTQAAFIFQSVLTELPNPLKNQSKNYEAIRLVFENVDIDEGKAVEHMRSYTGQRSNEELKILPYLYKTLEVEEIKPLKEKILNILRKSAHADLKSKI